MSNILVESSKRVTAKMKTLLICQEDELLCREGMARWLASFSELTGLVILRENNGRKWRRIRREVKRTGTLRFLDVVAFRFYYRLFLARRDQRWKETRLAELCRTYPEINGAPVLLTHSPNSPEAASFIGERRPDVMLACCKTLLKQSIFSLPETGTFVLHPGICPEYRNAHGCFWALASGDPDKVGMTLLRIDEGVDTGPVYGYYYYRGDERRESHIVIQSRAVFDHLDELKQKLLDIHAGTAATLDTSGRRSQIWGQPWLTKYLEWKLRARQGKDASNYVDVSRCG